MILFINDICHFLVLKCLLARKILLSPMINFRAFFNLSQTRIFFCNHQDFVNRVLFVTSIIKHGPCKMPYQRILNAYCSSLFYFCIFFWIFKITNETLFYSYVRYLLFSHKSRMYYFLDLLIPRVSFCRLLF